MKEAIILAGGFGTRLQQIVSDVPKPMADVNNKPFLEYILEFLIQQDFNKVILSVGYKKEIIKDYFKNSFKGLAIEYSEENEPLGTGGAIKEALKFITNENIYVLNGDTFFNIDLNKMKLMNSKLVIALKKMNNVDRYGAVEINENHYITSFKEKQHFKKCLINGGVYLLKKDIFDAFNLDYKFSFEDFLSENFKKLNAKGIVFDNYFIDIGIPEDYAKAKRDLKNE